MMWLLAALQAFALGSIPSGLWIGKWARRIDVREHGSGNLGATNVYRVLGPRWGLTVLLLDAAKGALATALAQRLTGSFLWGGIAGLLISILGHMFTPFASFRGGKGVATAAGAWGVLVPLGLGISLGVWILVFATTRIVSIASILAAIVLPIAVGISVGIRDPRFAIAVLVGVLIVLRHSSNLRRLLSGQEGRLAVRGGGRDSAKPSSSNPAGSDRGDSNRTVSNRVESKP